METVRRLCPVPEKDIVSDQLDSCDSGKIIGREQLSAPIRIESVWISYGIVRQIEVQETETFCLLKRAVLYTNKTFWLQVSPNLLDHEPVDDRKIQLFHSEFFGPFGLNLEPPQSWNGPYSKSLNVEKYHLRNPKSDSDSLDLGYSKFTTGKDQRLFLVNKMINY